MWWGGGGGQKDSPSEGSGQKESSGGKKGGNTGLNSSMVSTSPISIATPRQGAGDLDSPISSSMSSSFGSPSSDLAELRNLRSQFNDQEQLLGQLKDVLTSNSKRLMSKEREDYASRLSQMRMHKKAGDAKLKMTTSTPDRLQQEEVQREELSSQSPEKREGGSADPSPEKEEGSGGKKTRGARIQMLRKQLDEAKSKQAMEQETRRELETMVNNLQRELMDRDSVIASLQLHSVSASVTSSVIGSPFVMSPEAMSPSDSPGPDTPPAGILGWSDSSGWDDVRGQVAARDNKILELKEKVSELNRKVFDLEEKLEEKDEVIVARTQAVGLTAANLALKGKDTLEQLEDTRQELRSLQGQWADQESAWRFQRETSRVELEAAVARANGLNEANKRLERTRFDLAARNAEMQEKIIQLETQMNEMRTNSREEKILLDARVEEVEEEAASVKEDLVKREDIYMKRVAALEEQLKEVAILTVGEVGEKMVRLENKLAEAEEERGALQLKLVDMEDVYAADAKLKSRLKEAEEQIRRLEDDLDIQTRATTMLEAEKIDLMEALATRDIDLTSVTEEVGRLVGEREEAGRLRVSLEMRCLELEEERDKWEGERLTFVQQIEQEKAKAKEDLKPFGELQVEHSKLVAEHEKFSKEYADAMERCSLYDRDMLDKSKKIKDQSIELKTLEKMLYGKTKEIMEHLSEVDLRQKELNVAKDSISELQELVTFRDKEVGDLKSCLNESEDHAVLLQFKEKQDKLTEELNVLTSEKEKLEVVVNEKDILLEEVETTREFLVNEVERLNQEIQDQRQIRQEVESDREVIKSKFEAMEKESEAEINDLLIKGEKERIDLEHKLEEEMFKVEDADRKVSELNSQLENAEKEKLDLEHKLEEDRFNVKEGESEKEELNNLLEKAEMEKIDLEHQLEEEKYKVEEAEMLLEEKNKELETEKRSLGESLRSNVDLKDELEELRILLAEGTERLKSQEEKIKELQKASDETSAAEARLQSERDDLKEQLGGLSFSVSSIKAGALENEDNCIKLKEEVEILSKEIIIKNQDISKLREELSIKDEDIETLNSEMMSKYHIIEELQECLEAFEEKSDDASSENIKHREETKSRIESIENDLAVKTSDLNEISVKYDKLLKDNEELQKILDEKHSALGTLQTVMDSLQDKDSNVETLSLEITDLKLQLSEKENVFTQLLEETRNELSSRDNRIEELKTEVSVLLLKVTDNFQTEGDKSSNKADEDVDENIAQRQLEQIEMLKFQLREKTELAQASASDDSLKRKVEELSEALEMKEQEVEDFRVIIRRSEVEKIKMESRMAEIEQFRQELAKESNQHMEEAGEKMIELKNQADDKQEEVNNLLKEKEDGEKEMLAIKAELIQANKRYNSLLDSHDSGTEKIAKERDMLKEKNEKLTGMCKKYIAKIKQQDVQMKELKENVGQEMDGKMVDELNRKIDQFQQDLEQSKSENAILMEEMTSKYSIIKELQNEIMQKETHYELLTKELMEKDKLIKEKEEIIIKNDDSIREMKQKLEDTPEDVSVQVNVAENVVALEQTRSDYAKLKEKCKKLIAKVKQQDAQLKEERMKAKTQSGEVEASNSQEIAFKEQQEKLTDLLGEEKENTNKLKDKNEALQKEMEDMKLLKDKMKENYDNLKSEIEQLKQDNAEVNSLLKENEGKNIVDLESKLDNLSKERTSLYDVQVKLKDEVKLLKQQNSQLSAKLEEALAEIKKIRESNIIQQMQASPLLASVDAFQGFDDDESRGGDEGGFSDKKDDDGLPVEAAAEPCADSGDGWGGWGAEEEPVVEPEPQKLIEASPSVQGVVQGVDGWEGWRGDEASPTPPPTFPDGPRQDCEPREPEVEREADIEDGWGDDSWGGFGDNTQGAEGLAANLRLSVEEKDDDGLENARASGGNTREGSELRETSGRDAKETSLPRGTPDAGEASPRSMALQGKVMEKDSVIENLENQLSNLTSRFEIMEVDLSRTQEQKDEAERTMKTMENQQNMMDEENSRLIKKEKELKISLDEWKKCAEDAKKCNSVTEELMISLNTQIQELQTSKIELESTLDVSEKAREELEPLLEIKEQFEEALVKIEAFENVKQEFVQRENKWKTEIDHNQQKIDEMENEIKNLFEQIELKENKKTDLEERLSKITARKNSLDITLKEFQNSLSTSQSEVEAYKQNLSVLEEASRKESSTFDELEQLRNTVTSLETESEALKIDLEHLKEANEELLTLNSILKEDRSKKEAIVNEEMQLQEQKQKDIELQLQIVQSDHDSLQTSKLSLEQELECQREELRELEGLRSMLTDVTSENERIQRELVQEQGRVQQLQEDVNGLHQQLAAQQPRPPPDVTGGVVQPDVAMGGVRGVPDIMPGQQVPVQQQLDLLQQPPVQQQQLDLVQQQADVLQFQQVDLVQRQNWGWASDNNDNAANWFEDFEPQPPGGRFPVPDVEQVHQQLQNAEQNSQRLQELQASLDEVTATNKQLRKECAGLHATVGELTRCKAENSRLQEQLVDLQSAYDRASQYEEAAAQLQTTLDQLQLYVRQLEENNREEEGGEEEQSETEIYKIKSENDRVHQRCDELTEEINSMKKEREYLEKQLELSSKTVADNADKLGAEIALGRKERAALVVELASTSQAMENRIRNDLIEHHFEPLRKGSLGWEVEETHPTPQDNSAQYPSPPPVGVNVLLTETGSSQEVSAMQEIPSTASLFAGQETTSTAALFADQHNTSAVSLFAVQGSNSAASLLADQHSISAASLFAGQEENSAASFFDRPEQATQAETFFDQGIVFTAPESRPVVQEFSGFFDKPAEQIHHETVPVMDKPGPDLALKELGDWQEQMRVKVMKSDQLECELQELKKNYDLSQHEIQQLKESLNFLEDSKQELEDTLAQNHVLTKQVSCLEQSIGDYKQTAEEMQKNINNLQRQISEPIGIATLEEQVKEDKPSLSDLFQNNQQSSDYFSEAQPSTASLFSGFQDDQKKKGASTAHLFDSSHLQVRSSAELFETDQLKEQSTAQLFSTAQQVQVTDQLFATDEKQLQSTAQLFATDQQQDTTTLNSTAKLFAADHQQDITTLHSTAQLFATDQQQDTTTLHPTAHLFATADQSTVPSVETQQVSKDYMNWVQQELSQYQQAIADWQLWGETKSQEIVTLQESLAQYTEAYNNAQVELQRMAEGDGIPDHQVKQLEQLIETRAIEINGLRESLVQYTEAYNNATTEVQRMIDEKKSAGGDERLSELLKLNKVKALEVADLKETVDRLETEKSDLLEQLEEMREQTEELKNITYENDTFRSESSSLHETRMNLDEANEKLIELKSKVEKDSIEIKKLTVQLNEKTIIIQASQEKLAFNDKKILELEAKLSEEKQIQEDVAQEYESMQLQLQEVLQKKDALQREIDDLMAMSQNRIEEIEQLKQQALANRIKESEGRISEMEDKKEDSIASTEEEVINLSNKIASLETELESCKQYLADWQIWAETKNAEYQQLLEAYNAYEVAYSNMSIELNSLKEGSVQDKEEKALTDEFKPSHLEQSAASFFDQPLEKAQDGTIAQYSDLVKLKEVIEEKEKELKNKSEAFSKLQEEYNALTAEISNVKESSSTSIKENERLIGEIENKAQAFSKLEEEDKNKVEEYLSAIDGYTTLTNEVSHLKEALLNNNGEINKLKAQIEIKDRNLELASSSMEASAELTTRLASKTQEIESLHNEIMNLKENTILIYEELSKVKAELGVKESSLEIASKNVENYSELTALLESKNLEIESMRIEIVSLKERAAVSNEALVKMKDQLNDKDSLVLKSQLELKASEYGQLLEAYNAYVQAYNDIGVEANSLKEALLYQQGENNFIKQSLESKDAELLDKIKELELKDAEIADLKMTIDLKEKELVGKSGEIARLNIKSALASKLGTSLTVEKRESTSTEASVLEEEKTSTVEATEAENNTNWEESEGWDITQEELQTSSTSNNELMQLEQEISQLRQDLRNVEGAKSKAEEDLNNAKLKNGKMLVKVKTLSKEIQDLKSNSSSKKYEGFDDLDKALEEEMKNQVLKSQQEAKEAKKELDALKLEKDSILKRQDTLELANERFLEMKEKQDNEVDFLSKKNKDLLNEMEALRWKISELEERREAEVTDLQEKLTVYGQQASAEKNGQHVLADNTKLRLEAVNLTKQLAEARQEADLLRTELAQVNQALTAVTAEKDLAKSHIIDLQDQMDRLSSDRLGLKAEYDSLKFKYDMVANEKEGGETQSELTEFQSLNANLNAEIASLKQYIEQQQYTQSMLQLQNHQLQQQTQLQSQGGAKPTGTGIISDAGDVEKLREQVYREQQLVIQLERDLQNRESSLQLLEAELAEVRDMKSQQEVELRSRIDELTARVGQELSLPRSLSVSEEREILGVFGGTSDLQAENMRLKTDLDYSVRENRLLASRIETWKKELEEEEISDEEGLQVELQKAIKTLQIKDLKLEEIIQDNLQLLEERDTLQLKLSNIMRQYEKQKTSSALSSLASSRTTTPVPFAAASLSHFDPSAEIRDLHTKLDELRKLNYALDVELQREKGERAAMAGRVMSPRSRHASHTLAKLNTSQDPDDSVSNVLHV